MSWNVLPAIDPAYGREDTNPRRAWTFHFPLLAGLFAVLSLPPVVERTGVTPLELASVFAPHVLLFLVGAHGDLPTRTPRLWSSLAFTTNFTVSALMAFWTEHPATLFWGFFLLYTFVAAQAARVAVLGAGLTAALPFAVALGWSLRGVAPLSEGAVPAGSPCAARRH